MRDDDGRSDRRSDRQGDRRRETLFEFTRVGGAVRVSAVDTETNIEVTAVGTAGMTRDALMRLAERKLAYVLDKRRN